MKFDYSQFEQFIGKEIIVYPLKTRYGYYYEATIIDYEFIKYVGGRPKIFFRLEITNNHNNVLRSKIVTEDDFKKDWGFKGTRFGNYLINLCLRNIEKYKKAEEKKEKLKYPDCLKENYKKAYELYQDSLGSICYPIYNFDTNCYELQTVSETTISFENRKAYISPTNRNTYYWSEFRLSDLNKKFFLNKKDGLNKINELNAIEEDKK